MLGNLFPLWNLLEMMTLTIICPTTTFAKNKVCIMLTIIKFMHGSFLLIVSFWLTLLHNISVIGIDKTDLFAYNLESYSISIATELSNIIDCMRHVQKACTCDKTAFSWSTKYLYFNPDWTRIKWTQFSHLRPWGNFNCQHLVVVVICRGTVSRQAHWPWTFRFLVMSPGIA